MTFKHKLSRRLALLKDRWVLLSVTTPAAALAVWACERPVAGPQAPSSPVVTERRTHRSLSSASRRDSLCLNVMASAERPTPGLPNRSEEHTSELQSHSFISYAVFCLKKQ